jgi:hypothetical protein
MNKLIREEKTIKILIFIYCFGHHGFTVGLCPDCSGLLKYSLERVDKCPFGTNKPVCRNCSIHCYKPEMREKIRRVMRYAGPRLFLRHPILSLMHILDSRRSSTGKQ